MAGTASQPAHGGDGCAVTGSFQEYSTHEAINLTLLVSLQQAESLEPRSQAAWESIPPRLRRSWAAPPDMWRQRSNKACLEISAKLCQRT